jgi:RNA polymerase sigma-70 factor (ECF subfamily)
MKLSDKELVEKCIKKNPKAQKALYDIYSPMLFGICMRYARNREDAEDIFQEAFVKAYEQLNKYNFQGALGAWLRKLFINVALNYYRYDKTMLSTDIATLEISQVPLQIENLSNQEILQAIEQLSDSQRLIFNMIEIEGYSYKDLSEELNIKESTLRGLNFKAKKNLQEILTRTNK